MSLFYSICGWVGSIAFSICAAPQAYECWKKKHARGISSSFLALWVAGEVFTTIFVCGALSPDAGFIEVLPLISNYFFNFLFLLIIIYYKIKNYDGSS